MAIGLREDGARIGHLILRNCARISESDRTRHPVASVRELMTLMSYQQATSTTMSYSIFSLLLLLQLTSSRVLLLLLLRPRLRLTLTLLLLQTLVVQNVAWRNRRQTFVLKTLDGLIVTCAITGTTSAAQPLEKL